MVCWLLSQPLSIINTWQIVLVPPSEQFCLPSTSLFNLISSATMATCYRPDGTVASDQFACWNTTGSDNHAPCCMNSSYCYSNGWCSDPAHMTAFRAGCTDRLWQSDQCVQRCLGGKRPSSHSKTRHYPLSPSHMRHTETDPSSY